VPREGAVIFRDLIGKLDLLNTDARMKKIGATPAGIDLAVHLYMVGSGSQTRSPAYLRRSATR
jgi:hypothetical protein